MSNFKMIFIIIVKCVLKFCKGVQLAFFFSLLIVEKIASNQKVGQFTNSHFKNFHSNGNFFLEGDLDLPNIEKMQNI